MRLVRVLLSNPATRWQKPTMADMSAVTRGSPKRSAGVRWPSPVSEGRVTTHALRIPTRRGAVARLGGGDPTCDATSAGRRLHGRRSVAGNPHRLQPAGPRRSGAREAAHAGHDRPPAR